MGPPTEEEKAAVAANAVSQTPAQQEAAATKVLPEQQDAATAMASTTTTDAANAKAASDSLLGKLDELGSEFITAQEWAIFGGPEFSPDSLKAIIVEQLGKARAAAVVGRILSPSRRLIIEAKDAFSIAQRRRPYWYLGNIRFGLLPLIFTTISSSASYFFVFRHFAPSTFEQTLHNAAFWGLVRKASWKSPLLAAVSDQQRPFAPQVAHLFSCGASGWHPARRDLVPDCEGGIQAAQVGVGCVDRLEDCGAFRRLCRFQLGMGHREIQSNCGRGPFARTCQEGRRGCQAIVSAGRAAAAWPLQ